MPPRPTGNLERTRDGWVARISLSGQRRKRFRLEPLSEEQAQERTELLADVAYRMRLAGRPDTWTINLLEALARPPAGKSVAHVMVAADQVIHGTRGVTPKRSGRTTVQRLGEAWTSGELAKEHPDHVKIKRSWRDDRNRLRRHVYPAIGDVPIAEVTLDHAEMVMAALPGHLAPATRRQIAQLLSKLLNVAVYPCKLRDASPIPRGWLPSVAPKTQAFLYPDEEAALCACTSAPLAERVCLGFLAREGMRKSETLGLVWSDIDLARGVVHLDENKTDDPRAWSLGDDVTEALKAWRKLRDQREGSVFGLRDLRADAMREWLLASGVDRKQVHTASKTRVAYNVHGHRGTFVTLALACGEPESWVTDRTGHKSSTMVARYKRAARLATELDLGWLHPLHEAIPELC